MFSLKEKKPEEFLNYLCDVMEESDQEKAALALQKHYENAIIKNKSLHKSACFGKFLNRFILFCCVTTTSLNGDIDLYTIIPR